MSESIPPPPPPPAHMHKKYLYIAIVCIAAVVIGSVFAICYVGWTVKEVLNTFDENFGSATGDMGVATGLGHVGKGDTVYFDFVVEGDPVDFYIFILFNENGTSYEIIRWRDVVGTWPMKWTVPEEAGYFWNVQASGTYSHVYGTFYREYVKHFP